MAPPRLLTSLMRQLKRARPSPQPDPDAIHFLHIGKCAGTQLQHVIRQVNESGQGIRIVRHGHGVGVARLPAGSRYFFSIRNPVDRFFSGFYSRKRKGQPRIYSEWSAHEARAFARFEHANDLAESLDADGAAGHAATAAMKSIAHLSMNQVDWFSKSGFFLQERPPVWIVRTEHFDHDLANLMDRIGFGGPFEVSRSPIVRHANDYRGCPKLSDRARRNLRAWYRQDLALYAMCAAWIEERERGAAAAHCRRGTAAAGRAKGAARPSR